jgi:hypothetical protein
VEFSSPPGVSTLQDIIVGSRFSAYFRCISDLGIIISFSLVQFIVLMDVMALLEDKQYLGREDMSCPHFCIPLFSGGNESLGSSVKKKGVKRGYLMSLS